MLAKTLIAAGASAAGILATYAALRILRRAKGNPEAMVTPLAVEPIAPAAEPRAALLTEHYRPRKLADLFGNPGIVKFLRRFAANPYSAALIFDGDTGTGKTSAAIALAAELGCAVEHADFGGLTTIASGEQSVDAVRETCERMNQIPFYGSGWKVIIVNEADRMSKASELVWLDQLEALPARTVVVFTTNHADKLSQRFVDRCIRQEFTADADDMGPAARKLAESIFAKETGTAASKAAIKSVLDGATVAGKISFRRVVQGVQRELNRAA